MNIAILGFDLEGHASYDYFLARGHSLTICDRDTELAVPKGCDAVLGDSYLDDLDRFDLLVRTAGLHPRRILEKNPGVEAKITTSLNEFLRLCPTTNVIGITGTKGKGTTSTLTAKMLTALGFRVHLGGNIGVAPLRLLEEDIKADDWVVLELSSFQLTDVKQSPRLAACLMVVPEHLDWHKDMDEYLSAKQQLFRWQKADDVAVYYPENDYSRQITAVSKGQKIPYCQAPGAAIDNGCISISGQVICRTDELKLLGRHNWQNVCAAVTIIWQITQDVAALRQVATSFSGLPFRLEFRREVNGVRYYNDSFASGPGATTAALHAIPETKVMIMGGYDRGLNLNSFADEIKRVGDDIRHILVIGASGDRLIEALKAHKVTNFTRTEAKTMPEIVAEATKLARPGDAVVLSPAFASFDLFKNFEDRGEKFNEAIAAL